MMERRNSSRRNSPVGLKRETFYRFKPPGVVVGDRRESVRSQTQVPKGNLFLESRSVHRSAHVFWLSACPLLLRFASHRRLAHQKKRIYLRTLAWIAGRSV